ncbi:branched-chain amino acid ABC transporter permease [Halomarina oriensis]|uniref:Branched-chain amino acid ABC transporter permease n=1 Tax=Halomarina oriensis TaxID=671145 RepID=A0A6B0GJP8_9EURY|nr:branched-chain amino acid ABC transporter permease [Halomarina oriensis]MWG33033.1 branched-chain amino acid ABC transporter permease [Halomarina oriensis]
MSVLASAGAFASTATLAPLQLGDLFTVEALSSILLDGLSKAALYALIAMGLTLIFGLMGVLNFAHGSLTMLGAYLGGLVMVTLVTTTTGPFARLAVFFVGLVVVFGLLSALGGALEVGLIRPLYDRPPVYQILLTFGITLVIDELVRIVVLFYGLQPITEWQAALGTKPEFLSGSFTLGPVSVAGMDLFEILLGALAVGAVWAFLTRTRYGLVVRAGSEDAEMTEALGIDVRRVFTTVFALGAGLAGVAGMLLMWDGNWGASVPLATETLLPAFVVVIIGGLGTFRGTVVAALVVGLADALTQWLFVNVVDFPSLPEMTVFLILVVMLVIRPQGIFGRAEVGGH